MNTYRVSFNLDEGDLETFLKTVGPHCGRISLTHIHAEADPIPEPAPAAEVRPTAAPIKKKRKKVAAPRKRFSKVNSAILTALQDGPRSAHDLRDALTGAGMSPSSLSTGVSDLTKTGKIMRDAASGLYHLQYELPIEEPVAA